MDEHGNKERLIVNEEQIILTETEDGYFSVYVQQTDYTDLDKEEARDVLNDVIRQAKEALKELEN